MELTGARALVLGATGGFGVEIARSLAARGAVLAVHGRDAARLAAIDGPGVRALLGWPRRLPLEQERARLLREVRGAVRTSCWAAAGARTCLHAAADPLQRAGPPAGGPPP